MAAAPLQLQWNQFFVCETLQVAIMADGAARCRGIGLCCVVKRAAAASVWPLEHVDMSHDTCSPAEAHIFGNTAVSITCGRPPRAASPHRISQG